MKVDRFEPGSGGYWRFVHSDQAGNEFGFHGVTHEVASPERIIKTFEFEGLPDPGHVSLETAPFEALPGDRTRVTTHAVYQSVADRDGMIQGDMERGVNDSYDRLDEVLARLKE